MAVKRMTSQKVAEQRTYEKFRRDLDVLPPGAARVRKQAQLDTLKVKIAARGIK